MYPSSFAVVTSFASQEGQLEEAKESSWFPCAVPQMNSMAFRCSQQSGHKIISAAAYIDPGILEQQVTYIEPTTVYTYQALGEHLHVMPDELHIEHQPHFHFEKQFGKHFLDDHKPHKPVPSYDCWLACR